MHCHRGSVAGVAIAERGRETADTRPATGRPRGVIPSGQERPAPSRNDSGKPRAQLASNTVARSPDHADACATTSARPGSADPWPDQYPRDQFRRRGGLGRHSDLRGRGALHERQAGPTRAVGDHGDGGMAVYCRRVTAPISRVQHEINKGSKTKTSVSMPMMFAWGSPFGRKASLGATTTKNPGCRSAGRTGCAQAAMADRSGRAPEARGLV